jgi:hypothetical protein
MGGTTMLDSTALEARRARNTAHKAMTPESIPQRYLRSRASTGPGPGKSNTGASGRRDVSAVISRVNESSIGAACQMATDRVPTGRRRRS